MKLTKFTFESNQTSFCDLYYNYDLGFCKEATISEDEDGKKGLLTPHLFTLIDGKIVGSQICHDGIDFDRRVIRIKKFQVKQVKSNKQKIQPVSTISGSGDCFIVETNNELGLLKLLKES